MKKGTRRRIFRKAAVCPLICLLIWLAMAPRVAFGVPINDPIAVFQFALPPLPEDKSAPGGWGALFLTFNVPIMDLDFTTQPQLQACVSNPRVLGVGTTRVSIGCGAYVFDDPGTLFTITVNSTEEPINLVVEADKTFWSQKRTLAGEPSIDGKVASLNGTVAAVPIPEPGTLAMFLGGIGTLILFVWWRRSLGALSR